MIEQTTTENQFSTKKRNKYVLFIIVLTIFNIVAFALFVKTGGYDLQGNYIVKDTMGNFKSALSSFLVGFPILSLILGLIVALFPYKQLGYRKKYFRSFLLTLRFFNIVFAIGLFIIIIMTFLGWYPPKTGNNADNLIKEQAITTFKTEMKLLGDSANFYFDMAIFELEKGNDKEVISKMVSPKLHFFEEQIDTKTKAFYKTAMDAGLNDKEFGNVFSDIEQIFQPMMDKYEILKANGILQTKQPE